MQFTFSFNFWVVLQLLILPVILPALVGFISTRVTSSNRKAILLLTLTVITSFLNQLLAAYESGTETYDLGMALLGAVVTFALGVAVHYGLLKPTGTTERLLDSGRHAG